MKKIILLGRSGSGKTTLTQLLKGIKITYEKTQHITMSDFIIDTPGEYAETKSLAGALALYSYEADVICLLIDATEEFSLYSPNISGQCTRELIGIITKTDKPNANIKQAEEWLKLTGCEKTFKISCLKNEGISELLEYLNQ